MALSSVACGGAAATFTGGRYQNGLYGYEYTYENGPLPADEWKLDNYQVGADGKPTSPKKGEDARVVVDADGDGDYESTGRHPDPDVRYVHLKDDGTISMRTIPVSADLSQKDLKLLLERWVDSLSGEGGISVYDQSGRARLTLTRTKTYSTRVIADGAGTLSGYEAHFGLVEIANVDQLKLDPNHREALIEVVLARTDYSWRSSDGALFPVYAFATYRNHPQFFEQHVASFEAFLKDVVLKAPRTLPAKLAALCKVPDTTLHLHFGGKPELIELASVERLDEGVSKCLTDNGKPLMEAPIPGDQLRLFVHHPIRSGDQTQIPVLRQVAASPAAPAPEPEAVPVAVESSDLAPTRAN